MTKRKLPKKWDGYDHFILILERSRVQILKMKKFIVRCKSNLHALINFGYSIHKKK